MMVWFVRADDRAKKGPLVGRLHFRPLATRTVKSAVSRRAEAGPPERLIGGAGHPPARPRPPVGARPSLNRPPDLSAARAANQHLVGARLGSASGPL